MGITGKKARLFLVFSGIWAAIFLSSVFLLARELLQARKQQETLDKLRGRFTEASAGEAGTYQTFPEKEIQEILDKESRDISPAQIWKSEWESTAKERFGIYRSLKMENPDMAGWVKIEGTRIDYPVMHSPGREDYYLYRDFYGQYSTYGTPFLMESCCYENPRTNLLISGHHMKNGAMFAELQGYTDREFWETHPFVQFDTTEEAGSYEVAAVLKLSAAGDQTVWQNLFFPNKKEDFEGAWGQVKTQWLYDTGVELLWGDELLALVTCEYTLRNGRILVIARRIV